MAVVSLFGGALLLRVSLPWPTLPGLAVVIAVATFSCTGLGLLMAAVALRVREEAVLSNVVFGILLIFAGVNVPVHLLPGWMQPISGWLPLTHGIEAARQVSAGVSLVDVSRLLAMEAGLGLLYVVLGLGLLRFVEHESRRLGTLETY